MEIKKIEKCDYVMFPKKGHRGTVPLCPRASTMERTRLLP
jgi:hypothetical protein